MGAEDLMEKVLMEERFEEGCEGGQRVVAPCRCYVREFQTSGAS